MLLNVNSLPRSDAIGGFRSVNDEETVRFFVDEHLFELGQFKPRIASISEGNERLGRVFNDDVDHATFVVADDDGTNKNGKSILSGCFVA